MVVLSVETWIAWMGSQLIFASIGDSPWRRTGELSPAVRAKPEGNFPSMWIPRLYRWKSVEKKKGVDPVEGDFPDGKPAEARPVAGMFGLFASPISRV